MYILSPPLAVYIKLKEPLEWGEFNSDRDIPLYCNIDHFVNQGRKTNSTGVSVLGSSFILVSHALAWNKNRTLHCPP